MKSNDYERGYYDGSSGMYSEILEEQSMEYYDGVRDGMAEYNVMNPTMPFSYEV